MTKPQAAWMLGWLSLAVGSAGAAVPAGAGSEIRIEGKRLSVIAERMALGDLLAALEQRGIARVTVQGDASRIVVSDSFEASDATQVLRRVLSAHSHILLDRGTPAGGLRYIQVILLGPPGTTAIKVAPSAPSQLESSAETLVYEALSSASGTERATAAEALAYRSPAEATAADYVDSVLAQQLIDADENVRARALETLKDTADAVPLDALTQVAREDASAERRIQALELLAERGEQDASAPLRIALSDPEPAVRERARELIEDWHLEF
jgi:hypothetical protein